MIDQAFLVLMDKFNRVFDRDDMTVSGPVDIVDHGGESRGFSASGRTRHQDQPLVESAEICDNGRQIQLLEGHDSCRDHTGYNPDSVQIAEHVHTETVAGRFQLIRQVGIAAFIELFDIALRHDFFCQCFDVVTAQRIGFGKYDFSVNTVNSRSIA